MNHAAGRLSAEATALAANIRIPVERALAALDALVASGGRNETELITRAVPRGGGAPTRRK